MHRISGLALVGLLFATGCGSDSTTGVSPETYTLEPVTAALAIGQDSSAALVINVRRAGTDTTIKGSRLLYASGDYNIATVDGTGLVTAIRGGTTAIKVSLGNASVD